MPSLLVNAVHQGRYEFVELYLKREPCDLNEVIPPSNALNNFPPNFLHIALSPEKLTSAHQETIRTLFRHGASIESANGFGSLLCRLVNKSLKSSETCKTIIEIIHILYRNGEAIHESTFTALMNAKPEDPTNKKHKDNIVAVFEVLHTLKNMSLFITHIKNNDIQGAQDIHTAVDLFAHPNWPTEALFSDTIDPCFDGGISGVPLFLAAELTTPDMLIFLKEISIDLAYIDPAGKTAFHYAARQGRIDNIRWMWTQLNHEQKVILLFQPLYQLNSLESSTPKQLATENGHAELAQLLQQYEHELTPNAPAPKKRRLGMTSRPQPSPFPQPSTFLLLNHAGPSHQQDIQSQNSSEPYFVDDAIDPYLADDTTPVLATRSGSAVPRQNRSEGTLGMTRITAQSAPQPRASTSNVALTWMRENAIDAERRDGENPQVRTRQEILDFFRKTPE